MQRTLYCRPEAKTSIGILGRRPRPRGRPNYLGTELEFEAASNAALPRHPRCGHNVKGGGVGACIDLLKNGQVLLMVPAAVLFCKFLGYRCHLFVVS